MVRKVYDTKYRREHPEIDWGDRQQVIAQDRIRQRERKRAYRRTPQWKEQRAKWRAKNLKKFRAYDRAWKARNPGGYRQSIKRRRLNGLATPQGRIKKALRDRLRNALLRKGNRKSARTLELVGCSLDVLELHLERQFAPWMSWANYGRWHIDHIIPCARFDLSKLEEQRRCFHYTNLRPLWKKPNLQRGAARGEHLQPELLL